MKEWQTILISVLSAFIASGGFWAYLTTRREKKSATTRLLMGLAHDKILFLGMRYISDGHISREDYDDLRTYLWDPYKELGGNGTVDRVMREVSNLPLRINKATFRTNAQVTAKPKEGNVYRD